MRDKALEQNIKRVEAFVERWKELSHFLDRGFKTEAFTAEEEGAFLELKSNIAQEHELLMSTLGNPNERDDKALKLLNTLPSLQAFRDLHEGMSKKIASDWHNSYISFQALLGRLKGRQAQLAAVSTLRIGFKNIFNHPLFVVLLCLAAGYGVYRLADDWIPTLMEIKEKSHDKTGPGSTH
jgi:hypothetical protein